MDVGIPFGAFGTSSTRLRFAPWNPAYRYRFETFCYGPRSYTFYKAGAPRKVPGRKGMTWVEEDGVDEEETTHRGPDE